MGDKVLPRVPLYILQQYGKEEEITKESLEKTKVVAEVSPKKPKRTAKIRAKRRAKETPSEGEEAGEFYKLGFEIEGITIEE